MVQALYQNDAGQTPSEEDLAGWAETHGGLTFPVLGDAGQEIIGRFEKDNAIPSHTLLAPGLEVVAVDDWNAESMIVDYLPENWEPPPED